MRLEGFPKLQRLQCLHLSNNRINRIARNLEGALALVCSLAAVIKERCCSNSSSSSWAASMVSSTAAVAAGSGPLVNTQWAGSVLLGCTSSLLPCSPPGLPLPCWPAEAIPKLEWLILTNNRLANLAVSEAGPQHALRAAPAVQRPKYNLLLHSQRWSWRQLLPAGAKRQHAVQSGNVC